MSRDPGSGKRPNARWRRADYFSLAMNYSAIANHAVNLMFTATATFPPSSVTKT